MTETIQTQTEVSTTDDKDAVIAGLQKQLDAVKAKADELLSETKKAKQKAREEAEAKERATLEKAKKEGDYEELLRSSESQRKALAEQLESFKNKISSEKVQSEALKIASDLADGPNAKILSRFLAERLKYTDEGLRVLHENGEMTVSSVDDLKKEFQQNKDFQSLLRGNKSNGGGAIGNNGNSVAGNKEISRATFNSMSSEKQMEYYKKGGKVID